MRFDPRAYFGLAVSLAPIGDVEAVSGATGAPVWSITGPDPRFSLSLSGGPRLSSGLYEIRIEVSEGLAALTAPALYVDSGDGFNETEKYTLGAEAPSQTGVLRAIIDLPKGARQMRFDPSDTESGVFRLGRMSLRRRTWLESSSRQWRAQRGATTSPTQAERNTISYPEWIKRYDTLSQDDRSRMKSLAQGFERTPLISVVMPTYQTPADLLRKVIDSVRAQTYENWELCIADDASRQPHVRAILDHYQAMDDRIKIVYRSQNGHISEASNSALELANGEWIALLDHDDLLAPHALFCVAEAINASPDAKLFYSDEDKIDVHDNRFDPYFKSDWNPDLFLSQNMFSHLGVYRTDIVRRIGGFRSVCNGSQDYDLALRFIECINPADIVHIPHILYHWRSLPGSTAQATDEKPYAMLAGELALNEHFVRQSIDAKAELTAFGFRTVFATPSDAPLVSLVIPTRNGLGLLKQCLESIWERTSYSHFEIIVVDNGSDDPATLSYLRHLESAARIRILRDDRDFNYSALNNAAVAIAMGSIIGLINNDIEVISPDWLREMVSHAVRPDIGAVGARLWYPNKILQHGGVIMGLGGVAGHAHWNRVMGDPGYFARAALTQNYSAVTAACLLVAKDRYLEVGGLNEANLPVAFNDVDFCLKLVKAGYRNIWTPVAELNHYESATRGSDQTPEKRQRFINEQTYMKNTWPEFIRRDPMYNPNLSLDIHHDFALGAPPRVEKSWKQ